MTAQCADYYECNDRTAPGAGATIVSVAANAAIAGWYNLEVHFGYVAGTLGTAETSTVGGNMVLFLGGQQIGNLADGFLGAMPQVGVMQGPLTFAVLLDGQTSISLATSVAGSTGVVYRGVLKLTPRAGMQIWTQD